MATRAKQPKSRMSAKRAKSAGTDSMAPTLPEACMPTLRRVTTPLDSNLMGTVFGGAILSEIDLAAAIEAHKLHPGNVVTVAMDKIEFQRPVFVGDLISLYTERLRVGRTSVTVKVIVWADRRLPPFETVPVTEAHVTMVAVDEAMRPIPLSRTSVPHRMF
jgi:acyl-CoA thioesterase YciA